MAKNKLERFAENLTFPNMFQIPFKKTENIFELKGKWNSEFFKNENPIVLELGCGKGEYTVGLAEKYPNKNYIGIDIKGARMWRGCKDSNEKNLKNVAFLRTRIQWVDHFFSENEVSEIWITFPDPQPNKPNKRLTSERMLEIYRKILKSNALCHLKTDSKELYDYTLDEVLLPEKYKVLYHTHNLYESDYVGEATTIKTYYEQLFTEKGKKITYITFNMKQTIQE